MKHLIIPTDVVSANNRVYPHSLIAKVAKKLTPITGKLGSMVEGDASVRGRGVGGSAFTASDFEATDKGLVAVITPLATPEGAALRARMEDTVFRPAGTSSLSRCCGIDYVCDDYTMTEIVAIPAKDDAYAAATRPDTDDVIQQFRLLDLAKLRDAVDSLPNDTLHALTTVLKNCQRAPC